MKLLDPPPARRRTPTKDGMNGNEGGRFMWIYPELLAKVLPQGVTREQDACGGTLWKLWSLIRVRSPACNRHCIQSPLRVRSQCVCTGAT
jgi:hypothetical protein